jgi:integrase/recombinase XerD
MSLPLWSSFLAACRIRLIQQLLGHARLDTTQIYTEVAIRALREVHARTHPSSQV